MCIFFLKQNHTTTDDDAAVHTTNETLATANAISCKCDHQLQCDPITKYINSFDTKSTNETFLCNDNKNCIQKPPLTTTIPTAIVKPKYQRLPYDDRQLPPVVCIDREKSWFDNNNFNNNVMHANKRIQLPHFDRKSKKKFQTTAAAATICDNKVLNGAAAKDKFDALHLREKPKIDGSVVAIVTPRKKEKLDDNMANSGGTIVNELHDNSNSKNSSNNNNNNHNLLVTRPKVLQGTQHVKSAKEVTGEFFSGYSLITFCEFCDQL